MALNDLSALAACRALQSKFGLQPLPLPKIPTEKELPALPRRTYGKLTFMEVEGRGWWYIETEPHVRLRLKDMFRQIQKYATDVLKVSDSPQNCRDLEWFLTRYPLVMDFEARTRLVRGAREFDQKQASLERIMMPDYKARDIQLAVPLRPYQVQFVELWLACNRILNGDDVGLGKSAEAIGGLVAEKRALPAVVVCQTHLPQQWQEMCAKFAPGMRVHKIMKMKPYNLPPADVYAISYSKLLGWVDVFATGFFRAVVFDECQELRCEGSAKYKAAQVLSNKADYVAGCSATPVYNFGGEIFNIMEVIAPGRLGTFEEFKREWCGNYYGDKVRVQDPKALGAYLRENHLMLRRTRAEVGRELPPVNKIIHAVDHDEKVVEQAEARMKQIASRVLHGSFVERGQAARELDIHARMMTGVAKAQYVADYVRILLENGEKVLLAGWHRECYRIWNEALAEFNPVMYTGSESPVEKEKAKNAFISGKSQLMIISLRSGVGLDGLQQVCNVVVLGELDWSPGVHHQLIGRLARDGMTGKVTAIYLVSNSGTDPLMVDLLGLKSAQADGVMNPNQAEALEMTSDDNRIKLLAQRVLDGKMHGQED